MLSGNEVELQPILPGFPYTADELLKKAIKHVGRRPRSAGSGTVRWALVRDFFCIGSTVACQLCQWAEADPDERLVRW